MAQKSKRSQGAGRLKGRYANDFKIGHNAFEFVLDFGERYSEDKTVQFHTRIVTAPGYAQALLETLQGAIGQYEQTFGPIRKGEE